MPLVGWSLISFLSGYAPGPLRCFVLEFGGYLYKFIDEWIYLQNSTLTWDMEPNRPRQGTTCQDNLGPWTPALIITLKWWGRPIRDNETKHSTNTGLRSSNAFARQKEIAYTVKIVGCMDREWPCWLRIVMRVDHAAKKRRMCQHRKSAVASRALTNDAPGRRRGANLPKSITELDHKEV